MGDALNQRYGTDSVFLVVQGFDEKWAMWRERLSPHYTTWWEGSADCEVLV
ncbi:DUF4113 domain-containing protein [Vibrio algicola]|uniref:DUF4113 domain-containing protein n=1 Tax=Vibrio algicola TaxID=2662262 RepID=A0A5Q0TCU9_9VIBR